MNTWNVLTTTLDELDAVRAEVSRGRALQRTTTFFELVQPYRPGQRTIGGDEYHIGDVIQLDDGFCIVHWSDETKGVGIYSSILTLKRALCSDGARLLVSDISEQRWGPSEPGYGPVLTKSEKRVLLLVGHGLSNKEIADDVHWSVSHVRNLLTDLYKKLKVHDRTQVALMARDLGLETAPQIDTVGTASTRRQRDKHPRPNRPDRSSRLPSRPSDLAAAWRQEYRPPRDQADTHRKDRN